MGRVAVAAVSVVMEAVVRAQARVVKGAGKVAELVAVETLEKEEDMMVEAKVEAARAAVLWVVEAKAKAALPEVPANSAAGVVVAD